MTHRLIRTRLTLITLFMLACGGTDVIAAGGNVDLPRFPSISPDGNEIVFSWRGDLWKVPAASGQAVRLTSPEGSAFAATGIRLSSACRA